MSEKDIFLSIDTTVEPSYEVVYQPLGVDAYGDVTITFEGEEIDFGNDYITFEPIKYDLITDEAGYNITVNYGE